MSEGVKRYHTAFIAVELVSFLKSRGDGSHGPMWLVLTTRTVPMVTRTVPMVNMVTIF
jgi:hypothetical protein